MPRALPPEPKVSILIISFNQESFIADAIKGAVEQDYANLEVVVSDDASTDRTRNIIAEFAELYPGRVVPVLNAVNQGITGNSNAGLAACTGDLVAYMGGDDILLPGKIAAQVEWFLERPERVLCGHQVEVFYEDESRPPHPLSRRLLSGQGPSEFIRGVVFAALSTMVRADAIPKRGFDERLKTVSDQKFWIDVMSKGGEFGHVPGVFARHRRHSDNVTNNPLRQAHEVERQAELVAMEYPEHRYDACYSLSRHGLYDIGVVLLHADRRNEARQRFAKAIRIDPLFLKSWIRLIQSYL